MNAYVQINNIKVIKRIWTILAKWNAVKFKLEINHDELHIYPYLFIAPACSACVLMEL